MEFQKLILRMNLSEWSSLSEDLQRELVVKWSRENRDSHEYMDMAEEAARALKHELRFNGDVANVMVDGGAIICHLGPRWPIMELILDVCTLLPQHQMVENLPGRYCGFRVVQLNLREKMDSFLETLTFLMSELKGWGKADTLKWVDERQSEPLAESLSGGFFFTVLYDRGPVILAISVLVEVYKAEFQELRECDSIKLRNSILSVVSEAVIEAGSSEYYHPDRVKNIDWNSVRTEIKDLIEREKLLGETGEPK